MSALSGELATQPPLTCQASPSTCLMCQHYANQHIELVKTNLSYSRPVQEVKYHLDLGVGQVGHVPEEMKEQHIWGGEEKEMECFRTVPNTKAGAP